MECNVCFNNIETENLAICGNKKCSFRMCSQCTRSYKHFDNRNCPQCRLPITTRQFLDITPKKTAPTFAPERREPERSLTDNFGRICSVHAREFIIKINDSRACRQPNKNIFKCVAGALFTIFVPKMLGYYLCKGWVASPLEAWTSFNDINDICQPLAGAATIGMCGCTGYTCREIINIKRGEQSPQETVMERY